MSNDWLRLSALVGVGGLPASKSALLRRVHNERWPTRESTGRGGVRIEVHVASLPEEVRAALAQRAAGVQPAGADEALWKSFAQLAGSLQAEARRRLPILLRYLELRAAGKSAGESAREVGITYDTAERWRKRTRGKPRGDWLPLLAPRYVTDGALAEIHPNDWHFYQSLVLRTGPSSHAYAYRETEKAAALESRKIPSYDTFRRRFHSETDPAVVAFKRVGEKGLDRLFPPMVRDETVFAAYEALNIDGRKVDLFVDWDGRVIRPIVIVLQDIRTRMIVGWDAFPTESSDGARAVLLDTMDRLGRFDHLYCDNGRFVAAKQISGGSRSRFRWRGTDDDLEGLLPRLGVELHFTTPYSGRSKPIERAFLDFARDIDNDPRFAGAYVGNKPDAKPEDFTGIPVAKDVFLAVYAERIAAHDDRTGRRTKACGGKLSFRQLFDAEYGKTRPVTKLTAEQRRYFFLAVKRVMCGRATGAVTFNGNAYWSWELRAMRGQEAFALYDPRNAHAPIMIETLDHRVVAKNVTLRTAGGFNDSENSRKYHRGKLQLKKAARATAAALNLMTTAQMADRMVKPGPAPSPEAKVIRPFPKKPPAAANDAPDSQPRFTREELRLARERIAEARARKAGAKGM